MVLHDKWSWWIWWSSSQWQSIEVIWWYVHLQVDEQSLPWLLMHTQALSSIFQEFSGYLLVTWGVHICCVLLQIEYLSQQNAHELLHHSIESPFPPTVVCMIQRVVGHHISSSLWTPNFVHNIHLPDCVNSFGGIRVLFFAYEEFTSYFYRASSCYENNTNNAIDSSQHYYYHH